MKKILIVDNCTYSSVLASKFLEGQFNLDILNVSTKEEAIQTLSFKEIDLVLSDYEIAVESSESILNYIKERGLNSHLLLYSTKELKDLDNELIIKELELNSNYIKTPFTGSKLIDALEKKLHIKKKAHTQKYIPITTDILEICKKSKIEVYLQPKQDYFESLNQKLEEDFKTVSNNINTHKDIIYNSTSEFDLLQKHLIISNLKNDKTLESFDISSFESQNTIIQEGLLSDQGLDLIDIRTAEKKLVSTLKELGSNSSFNKLMSNTASNDSFINRHANLCALISTIACEKLDISSTKSQMCLVAAAFLQDIGLENKKLAQMKESDSELFISLDFKDKDDFLNHPSQSSLLTVNIKLIGEAVSKIILEHHENATSSGFPNKLGEEISKLGLINNISSKLARLLLHESSYERYESLFESDFSKYESPSHKEIVNCFQSIFSLEKEKEKVNLLLIDDDENILNILKEHFDTLNFNTFTAPNGNVAIMILKGNKIDAVISDIKMPDGDGSDVLNYIKKMSNSPLLFFTSGYLNKDLTDNDFVQGWFNKPYDLEEISDSVQQNLTFLYASSTYQK